MAVSGEPTTIRVVVSEHLDGKRSYDHVEIKESPAPSEQLQDSLQEFGGASVTGESRIGKMIDAETGLRQGVGRRRPFARTLDYTQAMSERPATYRIGNVVRVWPISTCLTTYSPPPPYLPDSKRPTTSASSIVAFRPTRSE